jgi:hypothetical protein
MNSMWNIYLNTKTAVFYTLIIQKLIFFIYFTQQHKTVQIKNLLLLVEQLWLHIFTCKSLD